MDLNGIGFGLSNELTVFAAYHDGYLKMVGVQETGDQEGRYKIEPTEKLMTFDVVKQAWESRTGIGSYLVKNISSSCSSGSLMVLW